MKSCVNKFLIVGGHSKAAKAFRRHLTNAGRPAHVLVRRDGPVAENESQWEVADYFAPPAAALADVAWIVNFAGAPAHPNETALWELNTNGPIRLASIAKAASVKRFVQLSSLSIYGTGVADIDRQTRPHPTSLYGQTKLCAEQGLQSLDGNGFATLLVRTPIIYGPDGGGKLSKLVGLMRRARFLPTPTRLQGRSTVHVDNLALALLILVDDDAQGVAFVADSDSFRLDVLTDAMRQEDGVEVRLIRLPDFVFWPLEMLAPRVYESLYGRSVIDPNDCVRLPATALPLKQGLRDLIRHARSGRI